MLPSGYIELTEAASKTVKLWFGGNFASNFSSEADLRHELALPRKQRRDRRWEFVRGCLRRAFRHNRLAVYLLVNDTPEKIEKSFWREPLSGTHPFGTTPLGKKDQDIFVMKTDKWQEWVRRAFPHGISATSKSQNRSLLEGVETNAPNKRGPKPRKHNVIVAKMIGDLKNGRTNIERMKNDTLEVLKSEYNASINTVKKARDSAIKQYHTKTMKITEN